jgi:argininosuccinate lyase
MKTLWGGRFKKEMHPLLKCFSYSLFADYRLLEAELCVDEAWVKMLARVGLLTRTESRKLQRALKTIGKELGLKDPHDTVERKYLNRYEDIHTLIQAKLEEKVGGLAKKIHAGRSRNDLVVTSTKVYLRDKIAAINAKAVHLQSALVGCAEKVGGTAVAGMTHLKKAQPVLLAHHLLAYVEMLDEDRSRLEDAKKRIDVLPLGSGALAGSSLPIDREFLAEELGFSKIARNSMAAVSDRAFLTEFMSHLAILWMHLSRLADDFILWNSEPFHYVELDDAFATGSSLMPHKKNPDVFELIRGRSAVIFGYLQSLLVVQKGLPLTYNRDLQEDKPGVFDAISKTELACEVLALTLESVTFNPQALAESVQDDHLFATDILEYLVKKGVPFREAHETVGKAVAYALEMQKPLSDLSVKEWKRFSKVFGMDISDLFDAQTSVKAKKTIGSTNPFMVQREISKWKRLLHA